MLSSAVSEVTRYIWMTIIVSFIQFMGRRALEHAKQWIRSPPMPPFPRNTAKELRGPGPIRPPSPPPRRGRTLTVSSRGSWSQGLSQSVSTLNSDVDSDVSPNTSTNTSPNTSVASGSRSSEPSSESRPASKYMPGE